MITRWEYRAAVKKNVRKEAFSQALEFAKKAVNAYVDKGEILELCLYRHDNLCFLYIESLAGELNPAEILAPLSDYLELWPEEYGLTPWAPMYPIYFQANTGSVEDWVKERTAGKTKIGRIAFLKHETMWDYVYWHKAITDEGLLKGDKYQYISLHEDILFSYYEEPRNNVNISGLEGESQAIKGWLDIDPGAHFMLEKTEGNHFMNIEPILIVERQGESNV